jgi:hypothetical protein
VISSHPKHVLVGGNHIKSSSQLIMLGKHTTFETETTHQALVAIDFQAHTEVQLPAITGIHPSKVLAIGLFGRPNKNLKNRNEIQWNI